MATKTTLRSATEHTALLGPFGGLAQMRELNLRVLENSRKAGAVAVDLYEKTVQRLADSHERIGAASHNDAVTAATRLQADVARTAAHSYASSARALFALAK